MYAAEKEENFRWISKIVATYSPYTLTDVDLISSELYQELAEIGAHILSQISLTLELIYYRSIRRNRIHHTSYSISHRQPYTPFSAGFSSGKLHGAHQYRSGRVTSWKRRRLTCLHRT